MRLDQLYQDIIINHYKHPRGRGLREPYQAQVYHVNPTCGDEITLRVDIADGVVRDVSYEGQGCSISQASASVLHELVAGHAVADAMTRLDGFVALVSGRGTVVPDEDLLEDGVAFEGVAKYPARVKCALLPWMAFKDAAARALSGAGVVAGDGAGAQVVAGEESGAQVVAGDGAGAAGGRLEGAA